jgi:hypothetical protein
MVNAVSRGDITLESYYRPPCFALGSPFDQRWRESGQPERNILESAIPTANYLRFKGKDMGMSKHGIRVLRKSFSSVLMKTALTEWHSKSCRGLGLS